jgi:hypothetical protein
MKYYTSRREKERRRAYRGTVQAIPLDILVEMEAQGNFLSEIDPCIPSKRNVLPLDEDDKEEVGLYGRVSCRNQSVKRLLKGMRRYLKRRGITVRYALGDVGSGKRTQRNLRRMAAYCRKNGIRLVVPCWTRLVRGQNWHWSNAKDERASEAEAEMVFRVVDGVRVRTACNPDQSPTEDEEFHKNEIYPLAKCKKARRPQKQQCKEKRRRLYKEVREMGMSGVSLREIQEAIYTVHGEHLAVDTIRRWCHGEPSQNSAKGHYVNTGKHTPCKNMRNPMKSRGNRCRCSVVEKKSYTPKKAAKMGRHATTTVIPVWLISLFADLGKSSFLSRDNNDVTKQELLLLSVFQPHQPTESGRNPKADSM